MTSQPKQTLGNIETILADVEYKDWVLCTGEMGDGFFLQWKFWETDNTNPQDPKKHLQGCRKWYISSFATYSEVVNTAFLAVKIAETHEIMERFLVRGKMLYNPHQDVFALLNSNLPNDSRQNLELSTK